MTNNEEEFQLIVDALREAIMAAMMAGDELRARLGSRSVDHAEIADAVWELYSIGLSAQHGVSDAEQEIASAIFEQVAAIKSAMHWTDEDVDRLTMRGVYSEGR